VENPYFLNILIDCSKGKQIFSLLFDTIPINLILDFLF